MIDRLKPYPAYKDSGVEWLGQVPEGWEIRPIMRIGKLFKGNGRSKEDEVTEGIPCVRYGDLYTRYEFFIRSTKACVSINTASAYTQIFPGDVLFAASGETFEDIGRSAVNLLEGIACCGGDILLLRPSVPMDLQFLGYATDAPPSRHQKATMGRGFTVVHIYASKLKQLMLALPPLPEQTTIVRFLGYMDRRIQRLIRAKQRLIKLLEEQKQAIIHEAVTGRIDVRTGKPYPSYKDSGVEWLGEVPEGWEVRRLKHTFRRIVGGSTPSSAEATYWEGDVVWITPTDVSKITRIQNSQRRITREGLSACSAEIVPAGSIIVTSRAPVGNVAIADVELCTNQGCKALVPILELNDPVFGFHLLNTLKGELQSLATGTTFTEISTNRIGGVGFPLPPLPEQTAIVQYLDSHLANLSSSMESSRRAIDLLKEYRTRLISDVVTGKVDVREAAALLPDEPDDQPAEEPDAEDETPDLDELEGAEEEGEE